LLLDSVRLRMIADVPIGILLSGGIDSSLVTAMAARVSSRPVKTFTISFPGHGPYDEGPYARLVARHFGTEHFELAAEPATVELLPQLARQYDEPMADSSMVPTYWVSRLIRQHATVALGGDGGDELFGGYSPYSWIQKQERLRRLIPRPVRRAARAVVASQFPLGFSGRNYLMGWVSDLAEGLSSGIYYFDDVSRRRLLSPLGPHPSNVEAYKSALCNPRYSPLQQATRLDFQTTMVDDYLVKVDRASMLNSLEVRVPWLDHRLVEFAFGRVPDYLRATEEKRKILPRLLAQRLLPPELDLDRKQGFSIPLSEWFKGAWGDYVESVLAEASPDLFDTRMIQEMVAGQRQGRTNTNRVFALTMFELWRREYHITNTTAGT
jgi:asparagine synthase (glutamine-hydrolysing)